MAPSIILQDPIPNDTTNHKLPVNGKSHPFNGVLPASNGVSQEPESRAVNEALDAWTAAVQTIPERCDLSGLSRDRLQYQLAATGREKVSSTQTGRSVVVSHDSESIPRSVALFAVHQMLKGFGNGSHTASASLVPSACGTKWSVSHTVVCHENQTVADAIDSLEQEAFEPSKECAVSPRELVKRELVDILVVFDQPGEYPPLDVEFPLIIRIFSQDKSSQVAIHYSDLFDALVINSMLDALEILLTTAISHPSTPISTIELLSLDQIAQLEKWNATDGDYPTEKRLHHLIEESAAREPNRIAIVRGEQTLTYSTLNERANRLAWHLKSTGIQPEQLIALFLDKNEQLIITILGIWKSGAAYVPIDPAYPDARVEFVLKDTQAGIIIASQRHLERIRMLANDRTTIIPLEPLLLSLETDSNIDNTSNLSHLPLTSRQLAYVTYTSGTTGYPKGIYKEHTSVVNSITDLSQRYGVSSGIDEGILLFSAYVFEPFVRQMLMALVNGHRLIIIADDEKFDPAVLISLIQTHRISYLNGTASVLQEYDFRSCPSLKRMILVGENLTAARYAALRTRFPHRILNEYGFTESAFVTALNIFEPTSDRTDMSLGRPVRNVKCYILNPALRRVPVGVIGELYIGGLGISRGYMNRPELTAERFLRNPFQTDAEKKLRRNALMYRTGDLARWLPNGEVEYLGRADFQIKLRGIRIEPGEIEATLAMHPNVRTSLVVSKPLLSGGQETKNDHLVGYVVSEQGELDEFELLGFLESKLPRYMIPTRLVQLPQIPVNINGKADLRALPAVEVAVPRQAKAENRVDAVEKVLADIWAGVLTVPEQSLSRTDSFFRLGGHSITCIQLIARVRQQLGVGISLEDVFTTKTLGAMADLIRSKQEEGQTVSDSVATRSDLVDGQADNAYLANSLQQGFVYHYLKNPQSDAYVMQNLLFYNQPMDIARYQAAWKMIQQQHPALRLRFTWGTEVMQVVDREHELDWRVHTLTACSDEMCQQEIQKVQENDRTEPYTLDKGPLFRLHVFILLDSRLACLFSCHHSILDGWSLPLLWEYLHEAYLGLQSSTPLPPSTDKSYALSQRYLQSHRDDHVPYWATLVDSIDERCDMNALLNEASRYKIPLGEYDQVQDQQQQTISLPWDDASVSEARQICASRGITLHSILQCVWHLVLHAYGGGTHTVTGTTVSGRHLPVPDIERALGLFINTLPLVIDHSSYEGRSVLEAFEDVQKRVNAMNSRANVELGRVRKDDLKHGLFDTLFVLENYPSRDPAQRIRHEKELGYTVVNGMEKLDYPLAVIVRENEDGRDCLFTICFARELFAEETIDTLLHMVCDTFVYVCGHLDSPIQDVEYLSSGQRAQLDEWNATEAEFPNCTLHALFEMEASLRPSKTAVIYEDTKLTYHELNDRANRMAYHLQATVPIRPNDLVALVTDKSEHMITSILAVWKTGGAYVPIDPDYPDDRIQYILEDTRAVAVIADHCHIPRLQGRIVRSKIPLVPSDICLSLPSSPIHLASHATPSDLAYVIYTSGTTGRPKGVMVEHHGVVNLQVSLSRIFGLRDTDDEVILSFSNYVFDHFVEQMTDALLSGQTLLVLNDAMRADKERLYRYISTNRVTYLSGTPSVISNYEFGAFRDHLRRIDCVGEAFSEPVFDKIRSTFSGLIINGYGPTETSITTHKRLYPFPERRSNKSIGTQVANSTSYVLDSRMKRVPIGAVGELFLGGDGVTRGYHNRADLTADRFPTNPFQTAQERDEGRNARLYKTGDLVRWIPGSRGEVEYLGRNDFQVKIRGLRIELGEIEAVLSSFPEIKQSVVVARERREGQKFLVGYYVAQGALAPQAIRRFMQTRLPDYMIPSRLIAIEKFPVTVSGKLDTKALPPVEDVEDEEVVAPRNEVERVLCDIWAEALEMPVEQIGVYSDFFGLGGDSLRSTKVAFAASQALGVSLTVGKLFQHRTIETLAHLIMAGDNEIAEVIPVENVNGELPVSPAQERLLFINEVETASHAYNIAFHLQLAVPVEDLEMALRAVIVKHEALRTLLLKSTRTGGFIQRILEPEVALGLFQIETQQARDKNELDKRMEETEKLPFSLDCQLPIRVRLFRVANDDNLYATFLFHHASFDAWSWHVFRQELTALLSSSQKNASTLSPLRVQYKEYAIEHRRALSSRRDTLRDFWSRKLDGLEPLQLPLDHARPPQFDYAGADIQLPIPAELTQQLRNVAKAQRTSLYTVLLAAYCLLLNAYTCEADVSVGIPVAHRSHPEFESVIGFFVNLVVMRVQISDGKLTDIIAAVQRELVEAQLHQDMPFQEIPKLLRAEHDPSRHPVVQTVFNWESVDAQEAAVREYQPCFEQTVAKFDLNVTVKETGSGLLVNFNYATSLFGRETVLGVMDTYRYLVEQLAGAARDSLLSDLSLTIERPLENAETNGVSEGKTLCGLFEQEAARVPDSVAVAEETRSITYHELNGRANQLANLLQTTCSIEPDDRIALVLDKTIDMLVCILAVWKAGAAYVPMDPSSPSDRIQMMLDETKPKAILINSRYSSLVGSPVMPVMSIDSPSIQSQLGQQPDHFQSAVQPHHLAYIIFTSGTTGRPKGVLVEHDSVVRLRKALVSRYFGQSPVQQSILFLSNYVFDFSIEQLVLSILSGNKLIIPPADTLMQDSFYHFVNGHHLSYLSGTPSLLQQIDLSRLPHLQMVTAAGEELHGTQYDKMRAQFRGPINNAYGITETTVYNIVSTFASDEEFRNELRDVLPGTQAYVLNDRLQPVPANAVGELYLAGECLTRGYLDQPEQTRQRFLPSPFREGARIYKTGDMVRLRGPGRLEYRGRRDQQVKLRGFRIELGDVQNALASVPGVHEAAVVPVYDGRSSASRTVTGLRGYYTTDDGVTLSESGIIDALSAVLPRYMIPGRLHRLQHLPVTVNGKLDLRALGDLVDDNDHMASGYAPPRNQLEVKLCQLWATLLNRSHCGIDDDLFALGGDSISSLQLAGQIHRLLGQKVTAKDLFEQRTVRGLHDNVLMGHDRAALPALRAEQGLVDGDAPLLPIQDWFFSKPLEQPSFWNHCFAIRTPALDMSRLRMALDSLLQRHDVLRTQFERRDGQYVQVFSADVAPVAVNEVDVGMFDTPAEVNTVLREWQSSFDLEKGPMWTVGYLHGFADGSARVWFALHHLIVDTVSWQIILSDLQALYQGESLGMKTSSVKEWALAVRDYTLSPEEQSYWDAVHEQFLAQQSKSPSLSQTQTHAQDRLSRDQTTSLLQQCCARLDATVNDVLLAAVGLALQETMGDGPQVVTMEGHGREDVIDQSLDVSRTVGWFTSMYPFAIPSVTELLQGVTAVKQTSREVPNHGIGYGACYGYTSRHLPAVSFNYLGQLDQPTTSARDWTLSLDDGLDYGLVTSAADANRSSSAIDLTFAVINGQMSMTVASFHPQNTTDQILQHIHTNLVKLLDLAPQHIPEPTTEFTPYFTFDGPDRHGPILFLLPPGEGGAESYLRNIVAHLPTRRMVVFNNLYRQPGNTLRTFEELAEYYLSHIHSIQSSGPYHLLGWSFGGILALEMARRLAAQGETLGLLALIDSYFDIAGATCAIGREGQNLLDDIYHVYRPDGSAFTIVAERTSRVLLFKPRELNEVGTEAQRELYNWYTASRWNNLDRFVSPERIEVVPVEGSHFTWVQYEEQMEEMCALL